MLVTNETAKQLVKGQTLQIEVPDFGQFNSVVKITAIRQCKSGLRVQFEAIDGGACGMRNGTIVNFEHPGTFIYAI